MDRTKPRTGLLSAAIIVVGIATAPTPLRAQAAGQRGRGQTPTRPPRPATPPKPAAPAAAKPVEPPPPPKPVAQDLHMKTVYMNGDQKTESVTYRKGERERFEFGDVIVLKQHDLKRTIQIMKAANTYMVVTDGAA